MAKRDSFNTADRELRAMSAILSALQGLDGESIQRVLDYVLGRLSLNRTTTRTFQSTLMGGTAALVAAERQARNPARRGAQASGTSKSKSNLIPRIRWLPWLPTIFRS